MQVWVITTIEKGKPKVCILKWCRRQMANKEDTIKWIWK